MVTKFARRPAASTGLVLPQAPARLGAAVLPPLIAGGALTCMEWRGPAVGPVVEPGADVPGSDPPSRGVPRQELVDRLIAGEAAAYEELVRLHGPRMLGVATRYLHRSHDAEDAVQDALLNVFRSVPRFKRQSRFETWLYRIVANCALMRLRTRRRKPHLSLDESALEHTPNLPVRRSANLPAPEVVAQAEASVFLQDMINGLPPQERQILQLREIFALKVGEVADVLDLSPSTVRVKAHRARLRLQRELGRTHCAMPS